MQSCGGRLSQKTLWILGEQSLSRIEQIHANLLIHRDVKPDNLVAGLGKRANTIYILDFGLAKQYKSPTTRKHIPYKDNKQLTGSIRYSSLNAHLGVEQARRDDLESLGFVLIYLLKGKLPWQKLPANNQKERYYKVLKVMLNTPVDLLCKDLPGI